MLITQRRNATVLLEFQHAGRPVGLLVDPMLAPRGSLPALRYLGTRASATPWWICPPRSRRPPR